MAMDVSVATPLAGITGRRRGFLSQMQETAPMDVPVSGRPPPWLEGSLLLNGPAIWDLPGAGYAHWFDGLALLHRLQFSAGNARYRSRFLDSEDARLTRARGRPELGGYDTPVAGGWLSRLLHVLDPRRTDNGCVVLSRCDGQWLALTESDRVHPIDPETLATHGELRWADRLRLPLMAAHPCIDASGRWWNVGVGFGRRSEYVLVSADRSGRREVKARIDTFRPGYLHAFAMSATHAVIWECAWRAHPLRFLFAGESYARHFDWMPERGSRLHAVRLADGALRSWEAPPLCLFHAAQAFDRGGDVVVDLCLHPGPVIEDLGIARLRAGAPVEATRARHARFVLSPGVGEAREEPLPGRFDLPQVNAAVAAAGPARYVWAAGASKPGAFFDRTIKLDHRTGKLIEAGSDDRVSLEPLFVAAPDAKAEDAGVLLVNTLSDTDPASRIRVLDAASLEELAVIALPVIVPFGFHGAWAAA
jgi:beta,beta-carotene 9',10'-dioxygenase